MKVRKNGSLSDDLIARDMLPISVRAFVPPPAPRTYTRKSRKSGPSEWALVFDGETTITAEQQLRFGTYEVYKGQERIEGGIFLDPASLTEEERRLLYSYAARHQLRAMYVDAFIDDVFYGIGYELRATIVGFNLPFDLSRLAIRHGSARGKTMRGGFTFQLSKDPWKPRVQVKHLSAKAALIQFTKPRRQMNGRGMRNRRVKASERRGAFMDVKTQAAAHTSRSFSLATLADHLETERRKHTTEQHGGPLTEEYIAYAVQDAQVTWECHRLLLGKFEGHGFTLTRASQILSEASIGKACLREMGIRPWREMQPEFPNELTGIIMSTYYGGRSEMHLRREPVQVLYCDFLSMYPTVCTLMQLWRFITARGMTWHDSTAEITEILQHIAIADLQKPEMWPWLAVLVQVSPEDDVFPVRAPYGGAAQQTIGANYLSSVRPLWFTLADCVAARLLTGKCPNVLRAITFESAEQQVDLKPIAIAGNAEYVIDPASDDFYRHLINLRGEIKRRMKQANGSKAAILDTEQQAIKILANATSYGIFVEFVVEELDQRETRTCYGPTGEPFSISTSKGEEPGPYFHPLIATLITGAARLMLAIAETLAIEAGLDWAFCDTDSMSVAKPDPMGQTAFLAKARSICDWFIPLNPYEQKGPLFKIEDANYQLEGDEQTETLAPLYCLGISAKRYVLFNLDSEGRPVIRKASAHGLGHLRAPYGEDEAPFHIPAPSIPLKDIGVERWQYDVWYQIIVAALEGHPDQVDLDYHPGLDQPAASRYAATTPALLNWFKTHNQNRPYRDQVRPCGFMLAFQAVVPALVSEETFEFDSPPGRVKRRRAAPPLKPIAPYNRDPGQAAKACFDRDTGKPIDPALLKTYRTALAQYHLSPESKFLNGEPYDRGPTRRRHVRAISIEHIGKEGDHWEEQFFLGADQERQIEYGTVPNGTQGFTEILRNAATILGQRTLAARIAVSRMTLTKLMKGETIKLSKRSMERIVRAIANPDLTRGDDA
jgi:DNA polymerase family B